MRYDVWLCWVNGRTSYRATPERPLDAPKPDWASAHLDIVEAANKRRAIHLVVKDQKARGQLRR